MPIGNTIASHEQRLIDIYNALNSSRKALGGEQVLSVGNSVVTLTVPGSAKSAIILCEADATNANKAKAVRFYESGSIPTTTNGNVLGDLDTYEVIGNYNLINFKTIGTESGKTQVLQVLYFE